ncbi:MarR family winged helix-turn-helix transcriptional regulator [Rhizobium sp. LjRoot30]|uniref:MarR family winged helix-turn-helix transcriptional regulator n=1 Tax=Rhizobium sp. LjRoot30 TaxID=3342320 RepID=UPI003F4FE411
MTVKRRGAAMEQAVLDKHLVLDRQLCFAVYATAHAFTRTYKPLLDPLGLTYPQYLVMLVLWEKGEVPVKAIGQSLDLDSGTLSPLLKRLEQAGLITRLRDVNDERQVLVRVTEKGLELKKQAADVLGAIGKAIGCDIDEIDALRQRLHDLRAQLQSAQDG